MTTDLDALTLTLAMATMRRERPVDWYEPHEHGQLQCHRSRHRVRAMFPGNRWGKTMCMGAEVAWCVRGEHPYQTLPRRDGPAQVIWVCPEFRQFAQLRAQLEETCWDAGWRYAESPYMRYTWPDGSMLWIISSESSWTYVQGLNPDLVCIDEQCPRKLYQELRARVGRRLTRYLIAATATQGIETWMHDLVYRPWLEHHASQGLDETRAMAAQSHDTLWVWPSGGVADNVHVPASERDAFLAIPWDGEKEARVRQRGGFASLSGDCVFAVDALDWLRGEADRADETRAGRTGGLAVKTQKGSKWS